MSEETHDPTPRPPRGIPGFSGLTRDQVHETIATLDDVDLRTLLADVVHWLRPGRKVPITCPHCRKIHRSTIPRFTDARGRVWHTSCVSQVLARLYPDVDGGIDRIPGELDLEAPDAD